MSGRLDQIRHYLDGLQEALQEELDQGRKRWRYRLDRGRVVFDRDMRARHRAARESLGSFLSRTRPLVVLTAPVIYALIVPIALLDLCVTIYQAICFPVYRITRVPRRAHIRIDRHKLSYLNGLQKLNCVYCGYANGVLAYAREIGSRTEAFWCPIKHARPLRDPHLRYPRFADFGDAEAFRDCIAEERAKLAEGSR